MLVAARYVTFRVFIRNITIFTWQKEKKYVYMERGETGRLWDTGEGSGKAGGSVIQDAGTDPWLYADKGRQYSGGEILRAV